MDGIASAIAAAVEPSPVEVVRAKRLILKALGSGEPLVRDDLIRLLPESEGLGPVSDSGLAVSEGADPRTSIADHPWVVWTRLFDAGRHALAELCTEGLAVPVGNSGHTSPELLQSTTVTVGSQTESHQWTQAAPTLNHSHYRLAFRHRVATMPLIEPDMFVADLVELELDEKTERCLREGIRAYHHGLLLAAASLLGATAEGAWMSAGVKLSAASPEVASAVKSRKALRTQAAILSLIQKKPNKKPIADELRAMADVLRRWRNYGVHPGEEYDPWLEAAFDDAACGTLYLQAHGHLTLLGAEVRAIY